MEAEKFDYIYREYRNLVLDVSYKMLDDFHLAQDVCQDVFVKLSSKRIEKLKDMNHVKHYLLAITYHRTLDYLRVRRRREKALELSQIAMDIVDLEKLLDLRGFLETVFLDLREKNSDWYEIVIRVALYDEPQELVARDMGISIGLLRTKYHRAKKWIRKHYGSEYDYLID